MKEKEQKMTFSRYEQRWEWDDEVYESFEEAVCAALGIKEETYKVVSCPKCGREERSEVSIPCYYCNEGEEA